MEAKSYYLVIKDNTGCEERRTNLGGLPEIVPIPINEAAKIDPTIDITHVTCNGAGNGKIIVSSITGGYGSGVIANYNYSINNGIDWNTTGSFYWSGWGAIMFL